MASDDLTYMARAIEISELALLEPGVRPFGALVVREGKIIGEGVNRSAVDSDPTSHGEIEAIRAACRSLQSTDLSGSVIYTSCEPCAMCAAAIAITRIDRVVYGASLEQSAKAFASVPVARRAMPVTAAALREQAGKPINQRATESRQCLDDAATLVLQRFVAASQSR